MLTLVFLLSIKSFSKLLQLLTKISIPIIIWT